MSQQRKSVRVVIVNWRTPLLTERAARSLWPQLRAGDELVVVDNASASADPHDNSLDHLRRLGAKLGSAGPARFGLVQARRNGGFGYGVNLGARNLRQDALVLLNSDAYALEGFVDALTAPLGHDLVEATTARLLLEGRWRLVDDGAEPPSPQAPGGVEAQTEPTTGATHSAGSAQLRGLDGGIWVSDPSGVELINSTGNLVDACGNGYDRSWLAPAKNMTALKCLVFAAGPARLVPAPGVNWVGCVKTCSCTTRTPIFPTAYAALATVCNTYAKPKPATPTRLHPIRLQRLLPPGTHATVCA